MSDRVWSQLEAEVLDELLHGTQHPLSERGPRGPGVYAFFFATIPDPCFDHPGLRDGGWPCYIGVADSSIAARLTEHRSRLKPVTNLDVDTFRVVTINFPSAAAARFGERVALGHLQPVYNVVATGLGAKGEGTLRMEGRQSRFSTLHPGRRGPTGPPKMSRKELRAAVRRHLNETVPPVRSWPQVAGNCASATISRP
jgi:hypothetical protein